MWDDEGVDGVVFLGGVGCWVRLGHLRVDD